MIQTYVDETNGDYCQKFQIFLRIDADLDVIGGNEKNGPLSTYRKNDVI